MLRKQMTKISLFHPLNLWLKILSQLQDIFNLRHKLPEIHSFKSFHFIPLLCLMLIVNQGLCLMLYPKTIWHPVYPESKAKLQCLLVHLQHGQHLISGMPGPWRTVLLFLLDLHQFMNHLLILLVHQGIGTTAIEIAVPHQPQTLLRVGRLTLQKKPHRLMIKDFLVFV